MFGQGHIENKIIQNDVSRKLNGLATRLVQIGVKMFSNFGGLCELGNESDH